MRQQERETAKKEKNRSLNNTLFINAALSFSLFHLSFHSAIYDDHVWHRASGHNLIYSAVNVFPQYEPISFLIPTELELCIPPNTQQRIFLFPSFFPATVFTLQWAAAATKIAGNQRTSSRKEREGERERERESERMLSA
jgi:hypothetical protein